jgi:hypothetical protein
VSYATNSAEHPALDPAYREEIVLRIISELRNGPKSFQNLVESAEGAYPADVQSALHGLKAESQVSVSDSGLWTHLLAPRAVEEFRPHHPDRAEDRPDGLPEPHPLDFDWRFDRETLAALRRRLGVSGGEQVAVLGAPTLYRYLVDSGANATLFDRNPSVVQHLRNEGYSSVAECDLLQFPDFEAQYQCAVADPPWYTDHYQAFLNAARRLLVPEGKLLLSVLPRLTRPSAAKDRFSVLECAAELGFDLKEVSPAGLRYVSPPFEIEALKADGIVLKDWRSGDLFSFVLRSRPEERSKAPGPKAQEIWKTHHLGLTTVKVKIEKTASGQPFDYHPVSPSGNIRFRSVSRRSPARSNINVWTSRNIALGVSKPNVLDEALQRIGNRESCGDALASVTYEHQLSERELSKLSELLQLLFRDAGLPWNE